MPQAREFDAKKTARDLREHRHYTPDLLGPPCPGCKAKVPKALRAAGFRYHPTCDPASREEMAHARPPVAP